MPQKNIKLSEQQLKEIPKIPKVEYQLKFSEKIVINIECVLN